MKSKKGEAGLDILLSVVTFIFVIGLLVMIYSYMTSEIIPDVLVTTTETDNSSSVGIFTFDNNIYNSDDLSFVFVANCTNTSADYTDNVIASSNYVVDYSANTVNFTTSGAYNSTRMTVTYSILGLAGESMNDTRTEIAETTDWFGIIIVVTAMVVLILLVTLIIRGIRGTGLMGTSGGGRDRGSA